jgi:hypothetical protein
MPPSPLARRVQILEEKVESLEKLPARIEALELQILQFREEVRAEFTATREGLGAEMRELETRLKALISDGDEETRRYMRVLHEEVIARIATIGEGGRSRP